MIISVSLLLCGFQFSVGIIYYNAYTDTGTITGKIASLMFKGQSLQFVSYLGIPYSTNPADGFRFRKVSLRESFIGQYNATYFRPPCLQTGFKRTKHVTSENCLFLNIYAPIDSTINPKRKYAVLIYIHGGNFLTGASNDISPEILTVAGDIIVVTVNYRLGILGFLSSGNAFAEGNYGLWDQQLAIRWIRYNIGAFGGDVENISLMGHGAGAVSAMLQGLYPGNRGLFHRIIAMSGTSLSPWGIHGPNVREIAKELDCLNDNTMFHFSDEPLVECVRNKPVMDIQGIQSSIQNLGPTIDGDFLIDHPLKIIGSEENSTVEDARNFFRSLDIVTGLAENDGNEAILKLFSREFGVSSFSEITLKSDEFEEIIIPEILEPVFKCEEILINKTVDTLTRNTVKYSVMFQYTNWTDPDNLQYLRENLIHLSTDANFLLPALTLADAHSYANYDSATYMYMFTHRLSYNNRDPTWLKGASHGAEILPMFGFPAAMMKAAGVGRANVLKSEYVLSENMMIWISNFVKTR